MPGPVDLPWPRERPRGHQGLGLARVAEALGWTHERPDYRDLDARGRLGDVGARIERLHGRALAVKGPLVLAGSSMGAFISGEVAARLAGEAGSRARARRAVPDGASRGARGLAAACRLPPAGLPLLVVHGWEDELIPARAVVESGARRAAPSCGWWTTGTELEAHVDYSAGVFAELLRRVAPLMRYFVPCSRGLEYLLAEELLALGATRATAAPSGVNAEGEAESLLRVALWSRFASRALWPLLEFDCAGEDDLYAAVHAIDWRGHLAPEGTLAVSAHVSGPGITHARFAAQRVKDAIVDRLRLDTGIRPSVDLDAPDLRLDLVVRKGRAMLAVDLAGPLHRRGWRQGQGEAR